MAVKDYALNVFFNCPFDDQYLELRNAMVFAIFDCGFIPRCSLEEDNGGHVRFDKIQKLIDHSKFGIHDISRTELDKATKFPRFNMPLELGVFIGAKKYGNAQQKQKNILILDKEQYRYQAFISDIAGHDIRSHENCAEKLIVHVRNWLNDASGRRTIPGGKKIQKRYKEFLNDLPKLVDVVGLEVDELTYNDYANFISEWLKDNTN
ncbi:MAG: nucleotide-binding protein [Pseudomonadales bacterium]|nr:nucleotide-binding protein [Pseudomonadales bacterium]